MIDIHNSALIWHNDNSQTKSEDRNLKMWVVVDPKVNTEDIRFEDMGRCGHESGHWTDIEEVWGDVDALE
jgi:hypothetical protein